MVKIEGVIVDVDISKSTISKREKICLTRIKKSSGEDMILVEDIYLCHYARRFRKKIGTFQTIKEPASFFLESDQLSVLLDRDYAAANYKFLEVE